MESVVIDGKYQVIRRLGAGGMGAVFEARHLRTGRRVAVKLIASAELEQNPTILDRFQREALATGATDTQHIVQVLDSGIDPAHGAPYMVMELLDGEDVAHVVKRVGPLSPHVALRIARQACVGLDKAHQAGVIHRDVKPGNLFLARRDGALIVKLLDFGIAKIDGGAFSASEAAKLTHTGSILGSPIYMSPEQAKGIKVDARTDIWSLGVVLYELLTGKQPHAHVGSLGALILAICGEPAKNAQEVAPWVPAEFAAVAAKALEIDPARRFASAAEMERAIAALIPDGGALSEAMLVPVPDAIRASTAPRPVVPASGTTTAGVSRASAPKRSSALPIALVSFALVGAATFAALRTRAHRAPEAVAGEGAPVIVAQDAPPPASPPVTVQETATSQPTPPTSTPPRIVRPPSPEPREAKATALPVPPIAPPAASTAAPKPTAAPLATGVGEFH